jgi:hypothetical protein
MLLFLRFMTGVGIGGSMVAFTLATEFVPSTYRGIFLILFSLFWTFGGVGEATLAYIIMPQLGWRYLLGVSSLPVLLVGMFSFPFLFESPRFYIANGRAAEARDVLARLAAANGRKPLRGALATKSNDSAISQKPWLTLTTLLITTFRRNTLLMW